MRFQKNAYHLRKIFLVFCIIMLNAGCFGTGFCTDTGEKMLAPRVLGGPCDYKTYKGHAAITHIAPKEIPGDRDLPPCQSYDVKFIFFPDEAIDEPHGRIEGREHTLMLTNSRYPGPRFLEKYGIRTGKSFECHVKVIVRGTCTPILFEFPTIDLRDYFEFKGHTK